MKILLIACKAGKAIQGSVLVTLAVTPMLPLAVGGSPGGQGGLLIRDPLRLKSSAVNSLCVQILAHRAGTFRSTPSPLFELYFFFCCWIFISEDFRFTRSKLSFF